MSLWKIAWRSLRRRALPSILTGTSMALGVALVVIVLVAHGVVSESFRRNASLGYDIVVGAKGGRLQLVLNTVYHLSAPIENIPYSYLREFTEGRFKPHVEEAIPYCLGDNHQGNRVVATVPRLFEVEYGPGLNYRFAQGRNFEKENFFEAVIGSAVAARGGLKLGDVFRPVHGVDDNEGAHVHEPFTVVGVLEPTGTPNDRALFVNIEGFYLLENHAKPDDHAATKAAPSATVKAKAEHEDHDHDHAATKAAPSATAKAKAEHEDHDHDHAATKAAPAATAKAKHEDHDHDEDHDHAPLPEERRELTAILVRVKAPTAAIFLPNLINEGAVAQAVLPVREIKELFDAVVGPVEAALLGLTVLIVIVSGIGILVSIYNSMSERRREIAIMRALGAARSTVRTVVLLESVLLSLCGGLAGWLLGHALTAAFAPAIRERTGVVIGLLSFVPAELSLVPGLILLAIAVGYLPASAAYRTDVAKGLAS